MKRTYIYLIALCVIVFVGLTFAILLKTVYYGYFLYVIVGVVFFILSLTYGKGIYFLLLIPITVIAPSLLGVFCVLNYNNSNGLNPLKFHPFTLAWFVIFAIEMIDTILNKKFKFDHIIILGFGTLLVFFSVSIMKRGLNGIAIFFENYAGPISFFLFYYMQQSIDIESIRKITRLLIYISIAIGVMGIVEFLTKSCPLEQIYLNESISWYNSTFDGGYRIKTIVGHPLTNALYFLLIMVLVQIEVKSKPIKYFLLIFFSVVILLTGSRSIFLFSFLILLYNDSLLSGKNPKEMMVPIIVVSMVLVVTFATPLGSTFLNRLDSGGSSTEVRLVLYDYFFKSLGTFTLRGIGGANDTIHLKNAQNQPILLENPWIILFFDLSYLFLLYIGFVVSVFFKSGYKYLIVIYLIAISSCNSFGVKNNINYFLCYILTFSYLAKPFFKPAFPKPEKAIS